MQTRLPSIAVILLALAILLHALVPRYDVSFRGSEIIRVDRWTGQVEGGRAAELAWVNGHGTAKFSDIQQIEPPAK